MVNIWLIRPGEGAFLWEGCKEKNCIAIGWEDESGFSKYKSLDEVKKNHDSNNANSIWYFYNDINIGDLVIAIKGKNIVLGIGKVESDYIGPKDPKNPELEYKNVRMMKWLIKETLENITHTFPNKTVTPNKNERWDEIRTGYIQKDPKYKKIFDNIIHTEGINLKDLIKQFVKEIDDKELQEHRNEHDSRSRNVQEKFITNNIAALNENDILNILRDTDAAYGIRFDLKDIISSNNGVEELKEKLIPLLETTELNETDFNKLIKSIEKMGYGFLSELLCLKNPDKFWICNSVTKNFLKKIDINIKSNIPFGKKNDAGVRYIALQPHLSKILNMLKDSGLEDATFLDVDLFMWWMKDKSVALKPMTLDVPRNMTQLHRIFSHTKNIILYGPPGTGKTFIAQNFIKDFLQDQVLTPKTIDEIKIDLIQDLTWYQVIVLAIYLNGKEKKIKVGELKNTEIIKDYFMVVKGRTKNIDPTLWSQLQIHANPNSEVIRYQNRSEPALFDKTSESEWYLIPEGIEYVENNLGDIIDILSGNKKPEDEMDINQYYTFVTFHQSYGYEDFIEGLKPKNDDTGAILYEIEPGVLKSICNKAKNDPDNKYALIIDEINRGNIPKIFGELITLIEDDKRLEGQKGLKVTLPYSKEDFGVPSNLYILGTMNTADRSIALLDIALRRRFTFLEIMPDYSIIDSKIEGLNIGQLLENLNNMVASLIDRDHQIGHSYLCGVIDKIKKGNIEPAKTELQFVWYRKIIPLLQEYFYNDFEQLKLILGDFVSEDNNFNNNIKLQDRIVNKNYSITEFEDWEKFSSALNYIVSNGTSAEEVNEE